MKYVAGTEVTVEGADFGEKRKAKINADKLSKLFGILESLYSDKYGSIIREYCSNAVDANIESGSNEPVIVEFGEDAGGMFVSILDNGIGINPLRMEDVFMNYGTSTKEDSNEFIGTFGLGSKVGLSYRNDFHIITKAEGIKYHYLYYKDADGFPTSELLEQSACSDSGTEIKLYIKDAYDFNKFREACITQLSYFDNVFVKNNPKFLNEYEIQEGTYFKVNLHHQPYNDMHIAFGRCTYRIDWTKLSISRIDFPIAIKVAIGEVSPTPSREDVKYTKETVELIEDRIRLVLQELDAIYESRIEYTNDINKLLYTPPAVISFESKRTQACLTLDYKYFKKQDSIVFKDFPWLRIYEEKWFIDKFFELDESYLQQGKLYKFRRYGRPQLLDMFKLSCNYTFYRKNVDRLEPNKNRFISQSSKVAFIKTKAMSKRELWKELYGFVNSRFINIPVDKDKVKEEIKKLKRFVLQTIKGHTHSYKDIVVPKEFLESLKSQKEIDRTKITVKDELGTYITTTFEDVANLREVLLLEADGNYSNYINICCILNGIKERRRFYSAKKSFRVFCVSKVLFTKLSKFNNCITEKQFKEKYKNIMSVAYTAQKVKEFRTAHGYIHHMLVEKIPILEEYWNKLDKFAITSNPLLSSIYFDGELNSEAKEIMERLEFYYKKCSIFNYVHVSLPEDELIKLLSLLRVKPYRSYIKQLEIEFKQQNKNGDQEEESGEHSNCSVSEQDVEYSLTE